MTTLHLTLKRHWFDMIANGLKTDEYREIKPYWKTRLESRTYDVVRFRNGYSANAPTLVVELRRIFIGHGFPVWGAPINEKVYILRLGTILQMPHL